LSTKLNFGFSDKSSFRTRVHGGDGRDADARRLDDVDGVDADARTDVARRRVVVPRHVGVMMVAMMLPSLVPMLWRYRHAVGRRGETRLGRLTALVGVGYFFVWTAFGMAAFPLGAALAGRRLQGLFGRSFQLEVRSEA
jgi:hypothetical protein